MTERRQDYKQLEELIFKAIQSGKSETSNLVLSLKDGLKELTEESKTAHEAINAHLIELNHRTEKSEDRLTLIEDDFIAPQKRLREVVAQWAIIGFIITVLGLLGWAISKGYKQ